MKQPAFRILLTLTLLFTAMAPMLAPATVNAARPAAPLAAFTITPTAQSTLWLDANKCNAQGPRGAWLSFVVTNASGTTQADVTITFAGFTGTNATYFKATQDPLRQVGALGPGESTVAYFYVDYAEVCNHPHGGGTTYDGYTANYTVTAAGSAGSTVYAGTVTTDELLTASAAGLIVSNVLGPTAAVGQIVTQEVTYSFGNNSDLFFQPSIEAAFNDQCWRLVDSKITAVSEGVTGITVGDNNRLWFPTASASASNNTITVTYYWESMCTGVSQTVTPWAAAKSGNKYKYSGASGTALIPPASQAVSAIKTGPACVNEMNKATPVAYTIVFSNSATSGPVILKSITDQLPTCMRIISSSTAASGVTAANSSKVPAVGAQGTVSWVGKYRGSAAGTTYQIPAAGRLTLQFTVDISNCPFGTETSGIWYTNTASGAVGNTIVDASSTRMRLPCSPLAVTLESMNAIPYPAAGTVEVSWLTVSEVDTAGFNLYRATTPDGPQIKLNAALIPAQVPGGVSGGEYRYVDSADLAPGTTYHYWIEDVDTQGVLTQHGPISVAYAAPNAVSLAGFAVTSTLDPALVGLAALAFVAIAGVAARRRHRASL